MDLLARKRLRDKKKEEERLRRLQAEEIFKKPEKAYVPSSKKLTIITFILFIIIIPLIYFKSELVVHDECGLMPGIECQNIQITKTGVSFEVHNFLKEELNITLQLEGCEGKTNHPIMPNQMAVFEFECITGEKAINKKVFMTYVGFSGLTHEATGFVQGTIE
ncbi:hypothetical protein KY359_04430 [Candidatus Woesearchaeota archaeon]|nr:hypothetical protein [Candidatus Woesearchaeota archaeon]